MCHMSHGQTLLAHHENDEVLERIYIDRRCKSEPEQLEKLSELCAKMTGAKAIGENAT
jgi:hypothetical protein